MPLIKNSSIEEIKAKVRIEDLVSRYVQLKKVGANYRGLSPFKHEKTPSFYVYPDKNFYYCFSTSQGGDIFKFVQTKENMSFVEAAEFIADRFGIRLEYERGAKAGAGSSVRKQIFDINEDAAAYYSAEFFAKNPRAESVRNYWTQERKFTLENAKELRIGFSPTDAEGLKKILAKKNYSPDALRECGLFFARESEADLARFHPRFRGRLMIPISDGQGRVIAFTARKTEFTPSDIAYEEGKYVNSPETPVFKKNMTLFNFDRAKKEAERRGYFILAEGQLDTIRMYCSGLENTVASQGTAAGAEHFALMKRHADRVVLLFDGDSAGRHAALRAIPICIAADIEPFVAQLPPDDDPDSFIAKNGADAMRELVENGKLPALKFATREILADTPAPDMRAKRKAMLEIFAMLNGCKSEVLRDDYLREIAFNLNLELPSVIGDYKKFKTTPAFRPPSGDARQGGKDIDSISEILDKKEEGMLTNAVYDALFVCLHFSNVAEGLSQILQDSWIGGERAEDRALCRLLALYREGIEFSIDQIPELFDDEDEKNLLYKLCSGDGRLIENPVKYANSCICKIHKNFISKQIEDLNAELKKSDKQDFELLRKISKLRRDFMKPPALLAE